MVSQVAGQIQSTVLPTALEQLSEWAYTFEAPDAGWNEAGYDHSLWATGMGGFGTEGTPGAVIATTWSTSDIWLRKKFTLTGVAALEGPAFKIHHDETVAAYLNGTLVILADGYTTEYTTMAFSEEAKAALKEGENVLAIHCSQSIGGQFIDLGIVSVKQVAMLDLVPDSRGEKQDWLSTTVDPVSSSWMSREFADEGWTPSKGGFGVVMPGMDQSVTPGTEWNTGDIWLRKKFVVPDKRFSHVFVNMFYDEDVEVYLNGTLIVSHTGYLTAYKQELLDKSFNALLVPGDNLLAVHCRQTLGGQFIDVGLAAVEEVPTFLARAPKAARSREAKIVRGRSGMLELQAGVPGRGLPGRRASYDFNGRRSGLRE